MAGTPPTTHVSQHHLEGSLADVPLDRILESCHRHLLTGLIRITAGSKKGAIELRAGAVDRSEFAGAEGKAAMTAMRALRDGMYEVVQRLPDLAGELGGSSAAEGDVEGVPLIAIMRHCEDNALTCTITVVGGFDRGQIEYRAGEIKKVELNGVVDEDAIVAMLAWKAAKYRVAAPPLELDVEGWPQVKDPTKPFSLKDAQAAPAGKAPEAKKEAKKPEAKKDAKPEAKKDAKPEAKPEAKKDAKPEAKKDAKPEAKKDAKPEAKKDAKPEAKKDAKKPEVTPEAKTDARPGARPEGKTNARPADDAEAGGAGWVWLIVAAALAAVIAIGVWSLVS